MLIEREDFARPLRNISGAEDEIKEKDRVYNARRGGRKCNPLHAVSGKEAAFSRLNRKQQPNRKDIIYSFREDPKRIFSPSNESETFKRAMKLLRSSQPKSSVTSEATRSPPEGISALLPEIKIYSSGQPISEEPMQKEIPRAEKCVADFAKIRNPGISGKRSKKVGSVDTPKEGDKKECLSSFSVESLKHSDGAAHTRVHSTSVSKNSCLSSANAAIVVVPSISSVSARGSSIRSARTDEDNQKISTDEDLSPSVERSPCTIRNVLRPKESSPLSSFSSSRPLSIFSALKQQSEKKKFPQQELSSHATPPVAAHERPAPCSLAEESPHRIRVAEESPHRIREREESYRRTAEREEVSPRKAESGCLLPPTQSRASQNGVRARTMETLAPGANSESMEQMIKRENSMSASPSQQKNRLPSTPGPTEPKSVTASFPPADLKERETSCSVPEGKGEEKLLGKECFQVQKDDFTRVVDCPVKNSSSLFFGMVPRKILYSTTFEDMFVFFDSSESDSCIVYFPPKTAASDRTLKMFADLPTSLVTSRILKSSAECRLGFHSNTFRLVENAGALAGYIKPEIFEAGSSLVGCALQQVLPRSSHLVEEAISSGVNEEPKNKLGNPLFCTVMFDTTAALSNDPECPSEPIFLCLFEHPCDDEKKTETAPENHPSGREEISFRVFPILHSLHLSAPPSSLNLPAPPSSLNLPARPYIGERGPPSCIAFAHSQTAQIERRIRNDIRIASQRLFLKQLEIWKEEYLPAVAESFQISVFNRLDSLLKNTIKTEEVRAEIQEEAIAAEKQKYFYSNEAAESKERGDHLITRGLADDHRIQSNRIQQFVFSLLQRAQSEVHQLGCVVNENATKLEWVLRNSKLS